MRYRLRTLMIVLALGPPVLAAVWLYPWFVALVFGLALLQILYLLVLPYCIAWLISETAKLIGKIPGQEE